MSEELLPCPFCGSKAEISEFLLPKGIMANCTCCGATAFWRKWNRRASFARADAEDAARPRRTKPRAWLHTMKYETGETTDRVTLTKENPWGISGRDYSEEYTVTSQPLGIIDAARQEKG